MRDYNNITLIGMPGSGKTTVGKLLAESFDYKFVDTDNYIEKKEGKNLQEIIDNEGNAAFCEIEKNRIMELLPLKHCIISPGGSVIYSKSLMETLKNISVVIFLDLPLKALKDRLINKESRGIVGLKSLSIAELYDERIPYYKKYADITINCINLLPSEIVNKIRKELI